MKNYIIKNYRGNIVESLTKFQKKYPGMKICEATEENGELKIKTEASKKSGKTVTVTIKPNSKKIGEFSFQWPKNKDPDPEAVRIMRKKLDITPETYKEDPYLGDLEWETLIDGKGGSGMGANICFIVFDGEEKEGWKDLYDWEAGEGEVSDQLSKEELKQKIESLKNTDTINRDMFNFQKNLTEIVIPENIKEIESGAFEDCSNLKSVVIPKGLKEIGWGAFYGCTKLKIVYCSEKIWNKFRDEFNSGDNTVRKDPKDWIG